jgi:hypothetical protein
VGSGVSVKPDGDPNRKRVVDEVKKFLAKKSLLKDPKTMKTYAERLGYFLDWCERSGIKHLDQLTHGDDHLPNVSFLRQRKTTKDTLLEPRYVYNIFQTCNTFLRASGILFAGEILGQLDYEEKEVKPYKSHELKPLFQAADDEVKLWMSHFLSTGCRDAIAMGFQLDCLDGVTGEGGKIVTQFSDCVSQIVNLKMNFRETTRVPRCQYQDAAFERKARPKTSRSTPRMRCV